jgi:hypothetical protein
MNVIDVDDHICHCSTGTRYEYEDEDVQDRIGLQPVYLVEFDHCTVWLCIECLTGLEFW